MPSNCCCFSSVQGGRRQSNPPQSYAAEFNVRKEGAVKKRKSVSSKAPKRKKGPWRRAEVSVQDDLDDDMSVAILGGETKTASPASKPTNKSDEVYHELAYLRAELASFKKTQKIVPPILEPERSGAIVEEQELSAQSLQIAPDSSMRARVGNSVTKVRTERLEYSSSNCDMERITLESFKKQARMLADIDIAEYEAAVAYKAKRRADALNTELQYELLYANLLRTSSK
jgi:hypothetical protein